MDAIAADRNDESEREVGPHRHPQQVVQLLAQGQTAMLNLIIKGDVDGSVQARGDGLKE